MADVDAVVVGAGVVGLAIAAELARAGQSLFILDSETRFGSATSSRNSEVIHAGIYYPHGSLKAALCTRGKSLLYAYCRERHIAHQRIGKLIVARTADQSAKLDAIEQSASAAGVEDLVRLDAASARALEPDILCHEALLSPSTGILDSHGFMTALLAEAENHGATFCAQTQVTRLSRRGTEWALHVDGEPEPALIARRVINAAGLTAHDLAAQTEGLDPDFVPEVRYARGQYFAYQGRLPFRHLIYPVPVPGGLGTHLTFDLAGAARFGPDVEWIETIDYSGAEARRAEFVAAARLIWPGIEPDRLSPAYAGIRPKLSGPGEPAADFRIDGPETHHLNGLVNLFGIESPGLTASLAIAELVSAKLGLAGQVAI